MREVFFPRGRKKAYAAMRNAPEIRMGLRPTSSTQIVDGMVATKSVMPTTPVASSEIVLSARGASGTGRRGAGLLTCEAEGLEDARRVVEAAKCQCMWSG